MSNSVPLLFTSQPQGGFSVTSPVLPELVIQGDSLEEAYEQAYNELAMLAERYASQNRPFPTHDALPLS